MLDTSAHDVIYAIGDAHGCFEQVQRLEEIILKDAGEFGAKSPLLLYLGDLIDRGPKSAHLLDHLTRAHRDAPRLSLRGNHEQFFLDFLANPKDNLEWLSFGGAETLASYGIYETHKFFASKSTAAVRALLESSIPESHVRYLSELPHAAWAGEFLLCHAGVDPTKALSDQTAEDYMWARERFFAHEAGYGARVVHGHTPVEIAHERCGRISLDTGAYAGGRLSAARLVINSSDISFLSSL